MLGWRFITAESSIRAVFECPTCIHGYGGGVQRCVVSPLWPSTRLLHLYPNPGIGHGRHEPSLQRGFPELTVFSQGLWVGNDTCELEKRTQKVFDNPHPDPRRPSLRHECDLPSRLRSDRCWRPPTVGAGSEKG